MQAHPGLNSGPPLDLLQAHPGLNSGPPLDLNQAHFSSSSGPVAGPHPRAREDRFDSTKPIDRLLKANPKKCDPEALAQWRSWLHGYQCKFGREPNAHPPDDRITAQWMACGEPHQLEKLLYDLMAERKEPGHSYAWFVTVALQRLHGISPQQQQARRAQLRAVPKPSPAPPPQPHQQPLEEAMSPAEIEDIYRQVKQAAAGKGMR